MEAANRLARRCTSTASIIRDETYHQEITFKVCVSDQILQRLASIDAVSGRAASVRNSEAATMIPIGNSRKIR